MPDENQVPMGIEEMMRLVYALPADGRSRVAAEEVAKDLETLSRAELWPEEGLATPRHLRQRSANE